jgi:hypothetical protein
MLPLTLRPTGLRNSAAFAHLADWCVIEDGEVIGHIYEVHAARSPEQAWFWSITALIPNPTGAPTMGTPRPSRTRRRSFRINGLRCGSERRHDKTL